MRCVLLSAVITLFFFPAAWAAASCPPYSKAVTNSNNWILLGGSAKGQVRQVIAGEFGKDVNSQKRVLGQFDRCGDLLVADISYNKNERNVILSMEQHLVRVQNGWVAEYAYLVKVIRQGSEVVVDNRQGTIQWQKGKNGNIISASDKFISMGKDGFTDTTYRYDKRFRLLKSIARGTDPVSNGEYRYEWNPQGLVTRSTSARRKDTYTYDNQWRELRLNGTATTDVSTLRTVDECQFWDDKGNCTLSYLNETEVFDKGTIQRHLSAVYKYQYWDKPTEATD
ncbi:hypothetical protein NS303_04750 [Pantoea ananatis]|uniref:hypothetical protein n=2 Tax=Pantoea ananas TaxID=553 RepID=UPI0007374CEF|nr:hypothetical protein [Pantoea ananatis]KTR49382.1 hypothetical protein NS303_04750 [Pantoea ananatis]KTR65526.1 hypothetical protein RSA47_05660 [Pantoea ananatis]KTR69756.1 hypothetical protein NS296_14195 [Pantoea ananatis]MDS7721576.1 hypothetical protein [Pantoea ananatis]PZD61573.1 hypothetical protein ARC272_16305 [Pantoea ananatis]